MNLFTVTVGGIFSSTTVYGPMAYPLVGTCILYPIGLDDSDSSDEQTSHAGNDFCEFFSQFICHFLRSATCMYWYR